MTEKRKVGIIAFGLPILLVMILMLLMRQYPFGDHSLLIWDMDWQYNAFFVHLRDIMHGDASPWYSFSRAIGGDMIGVMAYYLISPFNVLFYFFDASNIYAGIALVLLLKIGTAGWAMNTYFLHKRCDAHTLIFSTAYALSGYVAGYFFNIMWLDGVILLPLMILGIECIVDEGRGWLYIITVALGVITNFYIGYMLCIFSVLYFAAYFLLISEKKIKVRTIVLYGVSSLLGGMLSACVALPTVYSMQGGKSTIDLQVLRNFTKLYGWSSLVPKAFAGTIHDLQITTGQPLIYCGVFTVILVLAYFGIKNVSWKKKLAYLLLLLFMLVSMNYYNLCSAWQAFNMPNGSPYRFTFLYIFLLLLIAEETYARFAEILKQQDYAESKRKWKWDHKIFFAAGAVVLLVLIWCSDGFLSANRGWLLALNASMILSYILVVIFGKRPGVCRSILLVLMSIELCVNAGSLYHYSSQYQGTKVSEFQNYVESVNSLTDGLKEEDGLLRTVLAGDAYRTVNDSMLFNLYGLDSYTSVERDSTQAIAFQLGYYTNMVFGIHYKEGGTQAAESLLGVKYMVTSKEPESGYELLKKNGELGLYENKNALPIAVMVDETIMAVTNEEYDTFAYQNAIYSSLSESVDDVFVRQRMEVAELTNCVQNPDGSFRLEDTEEEGWVKYRLAVAEEGNYYLQDITADSLETIVVVNDNWTNMTEQENVVKRMGYLRPEDEVFLWCQMKGEGNHSLDNVLIYREDADALHTYAVHAQEQKIEIKQEREDRLTILCDNTENVRKYLLLTIPYDEGWTVTADHTEVLPYIAMENCMLIGLEPGEHMIELKFTPRGLYEGVAVTGVTAALLAFGFIIIRIRRQREYEKEEERKGRITAKVGDKE